MKGVPGYQPVSYIFKGREWGKKMNGTRKERSHKGITKRRKDTCLRAKQTKPWLL